MDLCSQLCLAGWPASHCPPIPLHLAKQNFKTYQPNSLVAAMLMVTVDSIISDYFHWPGPRRGVTRSPQSKTCLLHFLAHFSTDWDGIWYSDEAMANLTGNTNYSPTTASTTMLTQRRPSFARPLCGFAKDGHRLCGFAKDDHPLCGFAKDGYPLCSFAKDDHPWCGFAKDGHPLWGFAKDGHPLCVLAKDGLDLSCVCIVVLAVAGA